MTARGWTSADLPMVGEDDTLWTINEAANYLCMDVAEVREMVSYRRLEAVGKRRTAARGRPGRCARVYRAADLIMEYESRQGGA